MLFTGPSFVDGDGGLLRRLTLRLAGKIGVRPQLSLVVLIAILPLLVLLVVGTIKNRTNILEAAATRAADLAQLGAKLQDDNFRDAKNLLAVLRRLPQATLESPQGCMAAIRAIGSDFPQFPSIGFVDAAGVITCRSPTVEPRPFQDKDLFQTAMRAGPSGLAIGQFKIEAVTGKPIIVAAMPLAAMDEDARPRGIVFVSLDLDLAARRAWEFAGPKEAVLSLIDTRTATILVRSSEPSNFLGNTLKASRLVAKMLTQPDGGSVVAADVDGAPTIFGFVPLHIGGRSGIMVAVGLSRPAVLAAADLRLALAVVVVLVTTLAAAAAAWRVADRTQFQAISALLETAVKLGAGDLTARADLPPWQAPEFRTLSKTLGDMADGIAAAQEHLRASDAQLRLLAENATDMILIVQNSGQRMFVSPACRKLLGWEPEEMLQISSKDAVHPDDLGRLDQQGVGSKGGAVIFTYRMRRKDGSYVWVEAASRLLPTQPCEPKQRLLVIRDIDQRVAAEQQLRDSEARYRLLAEHSTDMVFQLDRDLVRRYVSPACREILGYGPEELVGQTPEDVMHCDDREQVLAVFRNLLDGASERALIVYRTHQRNGNVIWVETQLRTIRDAETGAPSGIVGTLRDISVRKAAEDQLERANRRLEALAGQDWLTGLANRRSFDDAFSRQSRRALRDDSPLGLIMIDVDHFKAFNDKYGHPAGDDCLRQVGQAIANALRRASDIAARYGGEEFAVLLPATDEAGAALTAERIRRAVHDLAIAHSASSASVVTISAGVAATAPEGCDISIEALVQEADRALYRAKSAGRNAVARASGTSAPHAGERADAA